MLRAALASSLATLLSLSAVAWVAGGCSSTHAAPSSDDSACTALSQCCVAMGGAAATTCADDVAALRAADSVATCGETLQGYVQAGLCSGSGFDAGAFGFDAGSFPIPDGSTSNLPCSLTGTCPPTDTSSGDAGGPTNVGSGVQCTNIGTCPSGEAYSACSETNDAGVCVAAVVVPGGQAFACASCFDCAAASASAAATCSGSSVNAPVDAGPDCGSPPALHPETTAGVYCPFTSAGAIDCAAGQLCCESPSSSSGDSACEAVGSTCAITGSLSWECDGPVDCESSAAGSVCCAGGTVSNDPVCSFHRGSGFTGSHCATSCAATEVSICAAETDLCPLNQTCTPFKVSGVVLGTCL